MIGQNLLLATLKFMLLVVVYSSEQVSGVVHNSSQADSNSCSCVGDTLVFECTVLSGIATIWTGSAFNCSSSDNEIFLLQRASDTASCNNGMITGQVVQVEEMTYTSQLNVTLSFDLVGEIIQCASNNGTDTIINSNTMLLIRPLPPPEAISLALVNFDLKEITFSWSRVAPSNCSAIRYNILASNCGSCPSITNHTNVTCIEVDANGGMCIFAVQSVVCGNVTGNMSEPLKLNTTETMSLEMSKVRSSSKVSTASLLMLIIGVSALLTTTMIVTLACCYLRKCHTTKRSPRFNNTTTANSECNSSSSPQSHAHATSQNESKDTYEYSQLVETPVNLKGLLEKLQGRVSKQWYQLGLSLGLPMDVLEGFNLYSENDCLAEVLDYWLKHHPGKPTWREITDAQKKVEMFNTEQDTGVADKNVATVSDIPPPKPPRRTSSVIMKKPMTSTTETAANDPSHEYEVIH